MIGEVISKYRILQKLGEGGMGEVYLAEDTELDRKVALKFLPAQYVKDAEIKARFKHEAKAIAALNHPNVVHVYEVAEFEDNSFIAMEYVEGQSLKVLLSKQDFSINEVIEIADQICDGMVEAHEARIVHRDLKPDNILLDTRNRAKIADFGLAKLSNATRLTREHTTLGTLNYMSPEQIEGTDVDHRSDIFSFGAVLYEMTTGRPPFEAEYDAAVMYAILKEIPAQMAKHKPGIPDAWQAIVDKALAKNRLERYQSFSDLQADMRRLPRLGFSSAHQKTNAPATRLRLSRNRLFAPIIIAMVSVGTAIGLLVFRSFSRPPQGPISKVYFTSYSGYEGEPAFSPDGSRILFTWDGEGGDNTDIYVKLVDVGAYQPNRLTQHPARDISPTWSPNGLWIAFGREAEGAYASSDASLRIMTAFGEDEQELKKLPSWAGCSWTPDNKSIAFADGDSSQGKGATQAIFLISVDTKQINRLTTPPAGRRDGLPAISPDGRWLAFLRGGSRVKADIFIGEMKSSAGARRLTFEEIYISDFTWTSDSREIIYSSGLGRRTLHVGEGGSDGLWRIPANGGANAEKLDVSVPEASGLAVSPDGKTLAYHQADPYIIDIWRYEIPKSRDTSAEGQRLIYSSGREIYSAPSLDGQRIAFMSDRDGVDEIWVCNQEGQNPFRVTSLRTSAGSPSWSPNGRFIAFDCNLGNNQEVAVVEVESRRLQRLTSERGRDNEPTWSPDGRWVYFGSDRDDKPRIWRIPPDSGRAELAAPYIGTSPLISPNGNWLYYFRNDSLWRTAIAGGAEVFMYHFGGNIPANLMDITAGVTMLFLMKDFIIKF